MERILFKIKKKSKMQFDSNKEIMNSQSKKKYYVLVGNNKENIKLIDLFHKEFIKLKSPKYLGLDFEFNTRKIALMQINFESELSDNFIFVFYPPDFSKSQNQNLINLLTDKKSIKILHGGESLDLPYLFDDLLKSKSDKTKFANNLVDTRYLCETYYIQNKIDYKCKIYYLLLKMKVISQDKLDELLGNENEMGPIYDIIIDVNKLSHALLKYTIYDVLFLPSLIKKFPSTLLYNKLVPQLTMTNFLEKKDVNSNIKNIFEKISKMNNYFINDGGKKVKLIDIYNLMWYNISEANFLVLKEVNYFKKFLSTLFKLFVYYQLSQKFIIYQKNEIENDIKLELQINFLKKFMELYEFSIKINNYITHNILILKIKNI